MYLSTQCQQIGVTESSMCDFDPNFICLPERKITLTTISTYNNITLLLIMHACEMKNLFKTLIARSFFISGV
jgi:hypothetical protein